MYFSPTAFILSWRLWFTQLPFLSEDNRNSSDLMSRKHAPVNKTHIFCRSSTHNVQEKTEIKLCFLTIGGAVSETEVSASITLCVLFI